MKGILIVSILALLHVQCQSGILYPRSSKIREQISLDGLWNFALVQNSSTQWGQYGLEEDDEDVEIMPVPASYNDISTNSKVRDHVGEVKYQRSFVVPSSWEGKRVWLRFGSVVYAAKVYINGELALSHDIGHLPFVGDVTSFLNFDTENDITVLVDNILSRTTIPQGSLSTLPSGRVRIDYTYDYFHYAGIDRPIVMYTTAETYVDDITLNTTVDGTTGLIVYQVTIEGTEDFTQKVTIVDKEGNEIVSNEDSLSGSLEIPNVNLWWPYLMSDDPGYQYTFKVEVFGTENQLVDRYDQPFGVRELYWDDTSFKINGKPVYLRGFGRHEDSDIRGKGLDLPLVIRDYNLIKWIGANCYRTSHYPYAEEIMDLADSLGIMIIDEVPAVNTDDYNDELLENHKRSITELIRRDKNRPSVVMWSAANEPRTAQASAGPYYSHVTAHVKAFDTSRPVTLVILVEAYQDYAGEYADILSMNKYAAWYEYAGDLDVVMPKVIEEAHAWHYRYNKPVLISEYGADTLEGQHNLPTFVWGEEYQTTLMARHFEAFDELRNEGWFIGEMIWNFADFKTGQAVTRAGGNKKGIFTRQRQPKASAHLMRRRYWGLAEELDNATQPADLTDYVVKKAVKVKDEF